MCSGGTGFVGPDICSQVYADDQGEAVYSMAQVSDESVSCVIQPASGRRLQLNQVVASVGIGSVSLFECFGTTCLPASFRVQETVGALLQSSSPLEATPIALRTRSAGNYFRVTLVMGLYYSEARMLPGYIRVRWSIAVNNTCCDGFHDPLEACDDGNTAGGDGCSAACAVEPSYVCSGATALAGPDTCSYVTSDPSGSIDFGRYLGDSLQRSWAIALPIRAVLRLRLALIESEYSVVQVRSCFWPGRAGAMDPQMQTGQCSGGYLNSALANGYAQFLGTGSGGVSGMVTVGVTILPDLKRMSPGPPAYHGMRLEWTTVKGNGACGDGLRDPSEECDDGNLQAGDGCSAACAVEQGYGCLGGGPNVCLPVCGAATASAGVLAHDAARPCLMSPSSTDLSFTRRVIRPRQAGRVQLRLLSYSLLPYHASVSVTECRAPYRDSAGNGADPTCDRDGSFCNGLETLFEREAGQLVGSNELGPEKVDWALRAGLPGRYFIVTMQAVNAWDAGLVQGGFRLAWSLAVDNTCGDGFRDPLEACDDGNTAGGDGCSAACAVEAGYLCSGGSATAGPDACTAPRTDTSGTVQYALPGPAAQVRQWAIAPPAAAGAARITLYVFNLVGTLLVFECLDTACGAQRQLPDPLALNYTSYHVGRTMRAGAAGRPLRLILTVSNRNGYAAALNSTRPGFAAGLFRVDWSTGAAGAAGCSNSFREAGEDCDDGNTADGDGCSAACQVRPPRVHRR